jgi:class 3 adenylate cyclase/tetratricopeptide (TPR) repeat protein
MSAEQRRIITILFSDIVGSTPIAEQLDPEDWREILEQVHTLAGDIVMAHHGQVLQYLGDGILAIFGADQASERDPERAIHAALSLIQQVPHLPIEPKINMRAAVHTGLVVLGELGGEAKRELTASGDAMNLAQRLQSLAEPGNVMISHDSYRYVRGLFDIIKQDPLLLRGRKEKVQPYLVMGYKERPFRMVTRGVGGVKTSTVGRVTEMAQLNKQLQGVLMEDRLIWAQIIAGPGLGKTRLLGEVTEALDQASVTPCILRSQALEGDKNQPYAVIRRMWFDRFQTTVDAPAAAVEAHWEHEFRMLLGPGHTLEALALGLLVGLAFNDHPSVGILRSQPGSIKKLALRASKLILRSMKGQNPLILLLEDLQWADSASWEYLTKLFLEGDAVDSVGKRALIVATARPEWSPPTELLNHPAYQPLQLNPLDRSESEELIRQLLQYSEALPDILLSLIVERAEGIPYFLEEIVNWLIDIGALDIHQDPWRFLPDQLREDMLPQTLHHLLSTRLNALGEKHQRILQAGAIFGRHFWEAGLQALGAGVDARALGGLEQRGFIQPSTPSSFSSEQEWRFDHNLMQAVAYESVLKRQRPDLHRAAALWLEQRANAANRLTELAGKLAHHYERAGDTEDAIHWYLEHDQFLSIIGQVEQRCEALTHTHNLARETGDALMIAKVQYHRGTFFESLGDYASVLDCCTQAIGAAEGSDDQELLGLAQALMVVGLTRGGQHEAALQLAERALKTLNKIKDAASRARILTNIAIFYTEYGDLGKGIEFTRKQIEINHITGEAFGEALGLTNLGYLYLQLGMYPESRETLELAIELASRLEAQRLRAYSILNLALTHWRSDDLAAAQKILHERAWTEFEATQDRFGIGICHLYAGICEEAGKSLMKACESFHACLNILSEINVPGPSIDALAGLARCDLERGNVDPAWKIVEKIWSFLRKEGTGGLEFPILAYLTCARVFEAYGESTKAEAAWKEGYLELKTRAERISDKRWQASYLNNIPEHRQMYEHLDQ